MWDTWNLTKRAMLKKKIFYFRWLMEVPEASMKPSKIFLKDIAFLVEGIPINMVS
jgi:hypothetical protein